MPKRKRPYIPKRKRNRPRVDRFALLQAIESGVFQDANCPPEKLPVIEPDGSIRFPAGIVKPSGEFAGAPRLLEDIRHATHK